MTVGAGPAGAGVRGHADRLDDHDDVVVVVHDLHALDRLGDDLHRRGRPAASRPRARPRRAPGRTSRPRDPSTVTFPAAASSAALVREKPNMRAMAASTRSPSRPSGTGRVRISGIVLTRRVCRTARTARPSRRGRRSGRSRGRVSPCGRSRPGRAPEGQQHDQDAAADDRRVGEVEDREVLGRDEVHDRALEDAGRTEDPVGEVAERTAEQQAERDRPGQAVELAGEPGDHHDHRRRDHREDRW